MMQIMIKELVKLIQRVKKYTNVLFVIKTFQPTIVNGHIIKNFIKTMKKKVENLNVKNVIRCINIHKREISTKNLVMD